MRATIECHENSNNLPPIQVMISLGGEDMSIKVSGNGSCMIQYAIFLQLNLLKLQSMAVWFA